MGFFYFKEKELFGRSKYLPESPTGHIESDFATESFLLFVVDGPVGNTKESFFTSVEVPAPHEANVTIDINTKIFFIITFLFFIIE